MKFYIKHFKGTATEGGAVRNEAFFQYFRTRSDVRIMNVASANIFIRVINVLKFIVYFTFRRGDSIYMHMGGIFILFPTFLFRLNLSQFIFTLFDRISKNHGLHIDVNDLPFEQNNDLELPTSTFYQSFQKNLFKLKNIQFDFASHGMRSYAVEKYGVDADKSYVVINGADKLHKFDPTAYGFLQDLDVSRLRYVYVGSLNKGRQIEQLIQIYEQSKHYLFLLGPGGHWIDQILKQRRIENIKYLGAFSDQIALQIASLCDMGVIPYDDSRFYYNLCYPTKVSFYLASGLPILSTPLLGTINVLEQKEVARFLSIDAWGNFIATNNRDALQVLKQNVLIFRDHFYWHSILGGLNF
ncbi:hypothetical protein [Sphingobacterium thalpophilum]|uniref:hypothetical protein n=1 Tax=Sphingobacterium thalpophilum TaxID=259 RepID=UPI003C737CB2